MIRLTLLTSLMTTQILTAYAAVIATLALNHGLVDYPPRTQLILIMAAGMSSLLALTFPLSVIAKFISARERAIMKSLPKVGAK